MEKKERLLHEIVITAIVVKEGKYFISKRSMQEKRFPGMWTVPGGRLEVDDYINLPKDTENYWYNVLEKVLRKEVKEEAGMDIENIEYVTSLATVHSDGSPSLVISCVADYAGGEVKMQEGESDEYAWVTVEEAKNYHLIDGIYDEIVMASKMERKTRVEWKREE